MARQVSVTPDAFELVSFDAAEIAAVAADVADAVELGPDVAVRVAVDESVIMAKTSSRIEGDTVVVEATGGAFESLRAARQFDEQRARSVLGQALLRARDRLDPAFGEAPGDGDLDVHQETAWAATIEGRLARRDIVPGRPQRRIYHFRVRHGFNDTVDAVFDRLWNSDTPTWAEIQAASDEARGATVSS